MLAAVGRLPGQRLPRRGGARVRHRLGRPAADALRHERRARADDVSARLERTDFFLGAVVTNHKRHEREVVPQYLKLRKKIENGARVRHQPDRLRRPQGRRAPPLDGAAWLRVPVLANVYVLTPQRRARSSAGRIPGVVVSDELFEIVERQAASPTTGEAFFLELAAKQVAIARGLGFAGVYLGGHMPVATFDEILDAARPVRAGRLARSSPARSSSRSRRVLLLRARRGDRPLVDAERPRTSSPGGAGGSDCASAPLPLQPPGARRASSRTDAPLHRAGRAVYRPSSRAQAIGKALHVARAGGEDADVRLQGLRRLLAARHRATSAPSRSARRTSATARAAGRATARARCARRSASGRSPTTG